MATLTRHVGRLNNTGTKVIVVFRKVPGDEENCLVVESDHLPDMYHDNMMTILGSREAQSVVDFYEVLHRNSFGDGGNCLQTLHETGKLNKVPVDLVEMMPYPNQPVALRTINNEIDGVPQQDPNQVVVEEVRGDSLQKNDPAQPATDDDRRAAIRAAEAEIERALAKKKELEANAPDPSKQAEALVQRASLMEETAAQLREEAYMLQPSMRPGRGRPKLSADEAEAKKEERNRKRRERYQAKKATESAE